jgi:hypothetical protein
LRSNAVFTSSKPGAAYPEIILSFAIPLEIQLITIDKRRMMLIMFRVIK